MNYNDDNCVCAEWDGKGWSTCGIPCLEHITQEKIDEAIRGTEEFIKLNKSPAEPIATAVVEHMRARLVMLKGYKI